MRVKVRFYGPTAELAGCRECDVEIGAATVAGVVASLRRRFPSLDARVRFAIGTEYAEDDAPVREGDIVSVIPPVGGG